MFSISTKFELKSHLVHGETRHMNLIKGWTEPTEVPRWVS